MIRSFSVLLGIGLAAVVATEVCAQSVEEFYRAKQIRMYIRAAPGGNYDVYSRVLARHMSRFIPGNPLIVPVNMPGGGGLVALNYVANVAPKDGTVLSMITQTFPMDQALGLDKNLKVDMRTLSWIGSMSSSNEVLFTARSSPTKTLDDAKRRQTVVAATGIGSIMTQLAAVYNNLLGTKFKVIYGYPSGPDMTLAMERGEVEGRSTSNPQVLAPTKAQALAKYNFIIQTGMNKVSQYEEVPLLRELAKNEHDRQVFDFISRAVVIARPVVSNQGVPADRVAALRRAFDLTLADPSFQSEAEKQELEINPRRGEEMQKIVADLIDTPAAVIHEVVAAMQINGADAVKAPAARD